MEDIRDLLHMWRQRIAWAAELVREIQALEEAKEDIYLSTSSGNSAGSQRTTVSDPTARLASLALRYDVLLREREEQLELHLAAYEALEASIALLPPVHRRVIDLRYRGQRAHSWSEICSLINYSAPSTYRIHDEAVKMLEKALKPLQHESFETCNSFPVMIM